MTLVKDGNDDIRSYDIVREVDACSVFLSWFISFGRVPAVISACSLKILNRLQQYFSLEKTFVNSTRAEFTPLWLALYINNKIRFSRATYATRVCDITKRFCVVPLFKSILVCLLFGVFCYVVLFVNGTFHVCFLLSFVFFFNIYSAVIKYIRWWCFLFVLN